MKLLFIGGLGLQEILLVLLIILILFGGKKIPELMKGMGKGIKSFKEGVNGIEDDLKTTSDEKPKSTERSEEKPKEE